MTKIYKTTYELVDISSDDEEEILERVSTPLPRCEISNYRKVLEIPHFPAEATIGEEEFFDLSLKFLESDCKRIKLILSYESIRSGEITDTEETPKVLQEEQPADSPESPDESLNSEKFIVERHSAPKDSASRSRVLQ